MGVDRHVELDLGRLAHRLALQLGHRLVHHLAVEVVADGGDVAALVLAEQVAGAADLEVAHGDLEAAPELGGLADRAEPLVGLLGERLVARVEQVGVGALARCGPTRPRSWWSWPRPRQVGAVDDERVHRRHVDARLDDRGAHEHVVLALPEVDHDLLERALVHLAVGDGDAGLGHQLAQLGGHVVDVAHAVVDVEDLALAQQLAADGLGDGPLVVARRRR